MLTSYKISDLSHYPDYISAAGMTNDINAIQKLMKSVAADNSLKQAFENCCTRAYINGERLSLDDIPALSDNNLLTLKALAVSAVPLIRQKHAALSLPLTITSDSCQRIQLAFETLGSNLEAITGTLYWFGKYYRETMFKTGLFEYVVNTASDKLPIIAYRHCRTKQVMALTRSGFLVDNDGCLIHENNGDTYSYKTKFTDMPNRITGYYVSPYGRIKKEIIELSKEEWEPVLYPGCTFLEIHIPAGKRLGLDECKKSFQSAAAVAKQCFSTYGIACMTCQSWIMNPDWTELLPSSNMASLIKEVYLYPLPSTPDGGFRFVFGKPATELDLSSLPRKSTLQKLLLERYEQGKPLRVGGMLIHVDDVESFGQQYYLHDHCRTNNKI